MSVSRRAFLSGACTLAAHPLVTPMAFATAQGDHRLVVILLRGGMDGIDAIRPVGDPGLQRLRPDGMTELGFELDGFYQASAGFNKLKPLWDRGELAFVQAVSTPYRDKRSHFDGQDILEAGVAELGDARDGWLNRLLGLMPGATARTAFAVGHEEMKIFKGDAPVMNWSPDARLTLTAQDRLLLDHIYKSDDAFRVAMSDAYMLLEETPSDVAMNGLPRRGAEVELARFAASQLLDDTRIASFSINGWDTHRRQARDLYRSLDALSEVLLTLREDLGPVWSQTTVVAMTEFGRTAAMNGTLGTDHGTGGAMVLAGGAVRGGRVYGDWPGLSEADLYARRDLMPTADVRAYAGSVIGDLFGIGQSDLERHVFPGLSLENRPSVIL